jgi:hypothetical protein
MGNWCVRSLIAVLAAGVFSAAHAAPRSGDVPHASAAQSWNGPRTADGQPDVQGTWDAAAVALETQHNIEEGSDLEHIKIQGQKFAPSNVITDPSTKRIPYTADFAAKRKVNLDNRYNPDPRRRDPVTSCFLPGVPRMGYQGEIRIVQSPGYVVMFGEGIRVIPLDNRPRLAENVKLWMGDSRGRWEGTTLVIESTNHNDKTWFDRSGNIHSDALRVVERWTFVDASTARYEATIEDPKAFTRPWKMGWTFTKDKEPEEPWEEACYEGNRRPQVN